ncbi:hypothetical protein HYV10_00140 [Candidatus Dependentiae bacterium]|nr:hypothetical protein [Candidatus Dependentiae bacterium]
MLKKKILLVSLSVFLISNISYAPGAEDECEACMNNVGLGIMFCCISFVIITSGSQHNLYKKNQRTTECPKPHPLDDKKNA